MIKAYFPQGIATDTSFCNRTSERKLLKRHIEAHEHVVLVGPRRYGKTSLLAQVLRENNFPGVRIDFFFVLSQQEVAKLLADGVSQVMSSLLPKSKKSCEAIVNKIRDFNPKLTINLLGQSLEIGVRQKNDKSISELLLALDYFSGEANKPCVLLLDEFQQIGELKENHAIEASIRHAVEQSKNVSYIFCGSKRHMLNEMFSNRNRPLYHLCELMTIDRISTECYTKFLKSMAKSRWGRDISDAAVAEIINITENHPYYVNALCRHLWHEANVPDLNKVITIWDEFVHKQSPWIISDISSLTLNKKRVLFALANNPTVEIQGQEFSNLSGIPPSSIKVCIDSLQSSDLIHINSVNQYALLDPAMAYFIRKSY
jgi:AAA+ ATPase superfamily predicted ATPase